MNLKRIYLVIELSLIFIYSFMTLFSIVLQPINIILGFFIIFILPGYNFLNLIKPKFRFIEKLGYSIILSLAVENVSMFFSYIFLYNYVTYPETQTVGVIFNSELLIISIIFLNLCFIIINEYIKFKSKTDIEEVQYRKDIFNLSKLKEIFNFKSLIIIIFFVLSLIFLCISTTESIVPDNDYLTNYIDYRSNFTFFLRVPLIFYLFLVSSIFCFIYIIFVIKNQYISLISISIFLYCLLILPYLQINNYFAHDAYNLSRYYEIYLDYGVTTFRRHNFVIFNFDSLRYSTSLFTTILLITATNMNLNFTLWYLYPLLYIFLPFFFYSVFYKYSNNKKESSLILIVSIIFVIFTPQFIKYGHATGTGVLGILIYFILIIEFYDLLQNNNFNITNSLFIILLYFFLCLTHFEECLYFLALIIPYFIYHLFFELKDVSNNFKTYVNYSEASLKKEAFILHQIIKNKSIKSKNKINQIKFGFLLFFLILLFYFAIEFFGYFDLYFSTLIERFSFLEFLNNYYLGTRDAVLFFLRGEISFSIFILILIFWGVLLINLFIHFIVFKNHNFIIKIYNYLNNYCQKIFNFIIKLISTKLFQISFFLIFFALIIFTNLFFLPSLEETLILTIVSLILSYFILVLQFFFFIKGLKYYKLTNEIQNFFLISIIASSTIMVILTIIESFWLVIYILHTKFLSYFVFFNLIIIQNTYLQYLREKKNNLLIFIIIFVLIFGIFFGLRTLAYG